MKRVAIACLGITAVACSTPAGVPYHPTDTAGVVKTLFIARAQAPERPFDGGTTIALRVCAEIPQLAGSTHAWVTTSEGKIGGQDPGATATVTLVRPASGPRYEGEVNLILRSDSVARVTAQVGESAAVADIAPGPGDGGATPAPSDPCN